MRNLREAYIQSDCPAPHILEKKVYALWYSLPLHGWYHKHCFPSGVYMPWYKILFDNIARFTGSRCIRDQEKKMILSFVFHHISGVPEGFRVWQNQQGLRSFYCLVSLNGLHHILSNSLEMTKQVGAFFPTDVLLIIFYSGNLYLHNFTAMISDKRSPAVTVKSIGR